MKIARHNMMVYLVIGWYFQLSFFSYMLYSIFFLYFFRWLFLNRGILVDPLCVRMTADTGGCWEPHPVVPVGVSSQTIGRHCTRECPAKWHGSVQEQVWSSSWRFSVLFRNQLNVMKSCRVDCFCDYYRRKLCNINFVQFLIINKSVWKRSEFYLRYHTVDLITPRYWSCSVLIVLTNQIVTSFRLPDISEVLTFRSE